MYLEKRLLKAKISYFIWRILFFIIFSGFCALLYIIWEEDKTNWDVKSKFVLSGLLYRSTQRPLLKSCPTSCSGCWGQTFHLSVVVVVVCFFKSIFLQLFVRSVAHRRVNVCRTTRVLQTAVLTLLPWQREDTPGSWKVDSDVVCKQRMFICVIDQNTNKHYKLSVCVFWYLLCCEVHCLKMPCGD